MLFMVLYFCRTKMVQKKIIKMRNELINKMKKRGYELKNEFNLRNETSFIFDKEFKKNTLSIMFTYNNAEKKFNRNFGKLKIEKDDGNIEIF